MATAPLVGLVGRKRSGKDFAAAHLVNALGWQRLAFADAVREALLIADPLVPVDEAGACARVSAVVRAEGWEGAKAHPEVRRLLQALGMGVREAAGEHVWVRAVGAAATRLRECGVGVVVTDVRFHNEALMVGAMGGHLVEVRRPSLLGVLDEADAHVSEQFAQDADTLARLVSRVVVNDEGGDGVREFTRWAAALSR